VNDLQLIPLGTVAEDSREPWRIPELRGGGNRPETLRETEVQVGDLDGAGGFVPSPPSDTYTSSTRAMARASSIVLALSDTVPVVSRYVS
jgi:hypothetical protein